MIWMQVIRAGCPALSAKQMHAMAERVRLRLQPPPAPAPASRPPYGPGARRAARRAGASAGR